MLPRKNLEATRSSGIAQAFIGILGSPGRLLIVTGVLFMVRSGFQLQDAASYASASSFSRVEIWLESARCAKETGALLTVGGKGRTLYPIEDASLADDRGHALLTGLYAKILDRAPDRVTLVRINLLINIFGIAVLTFLLFIGNLPWTAVGFLAVSAFMGIPGPLPGPDVTAAYHGILFLALAPPVWLCLRSAQGTLRTGTLLLEEVFFALIFCAVSLLRQPIALAALPAIVVASLFLAYHSKRRVMGIAFYLAFCLSAIVAYRAVTPCILGLRNKLYSVQPGRGVQDHGISHDLFIGLGVYSNPWGIRWDDMYGEEVVKSVDPTVRYCSPRYFEILWERYWKTIKSDPMVAARIYLRKGFESMKITLPPVLITIFLGFSGLLVFGYYKSAGEIKKTFARSTLLIWILLLSQAAFLAQGVLALPSWDYLYPGVFLWALLILIVVEQVVAPKVCFLLRRSARRMA